MDEIAERAVIQYLQKKGLSFNDIHSSIHSKIGNWLRLQHGRQAFEDDTDPRKPVTEAPQKMFNRVCDIFIDKKPFTVG